jgi:hypothetical protein
MKETKPDLIFEDKREKTEDESFNDNEKAKSKRGKWLKWILKIIDTIFTAAT